MPPYQASKAPVGEAGKERAARTAETPGALRALHGLHGPIFVQNPDGTITEGVPSDHKEPTKPRRGRRGREHGAIDDSDGGSMSDNPSATMQQEVDFMYIRHERILVLLVVTQICVEILYSFVYVMRMKDGSSVMEFTSMYINLRMSPHAATTILWTIFGLQVTFGVIYYAIAALALWSKRPKYWRMLANVSILGILGLVLLAYVDKFNLVIFFLHLLSYIYARFLQGLTASLLLLPPAAPRLAAA